MFHNSEETGGPDSAALLALRDVLVRHRRLVVCTALVGLALGVFYVGTRQPSYRATATLLLESDSGSGGILGDLAAITSAPVATSQMEILRSRGIAEAVVREGNVEELGATETEAPRKSLGLTTLVEEHRLRPVPAWWNRLTGASERPDERPRLRAIYTPNTKGADLPPVEVSFPSADRVIVSSPSIFSRFGVSGGEAREHEYALGAPIELPDGRLRLFAGGALTGRSYTIRALHPLDALEHVMDRTRVSETERNSGVIRLTYDDSDPHRAAEVAHALCLNYLDRNEDSGQRRASKTVDFIEEQLTKQMTALGEAEVDVVEFQRANPRAVDVGESARALIDELSGLEVKEVELRVARMELEQALELLENGEIEALSRLGEGLSDPITRSYVEQIARLTAERDLLERREGGAYKTMVQGRALELSSQVEALRLKLSSLRGVAAALTDGDTSGLGRLASAEDAGTQDPVLRSYLEQWASLEAEIAEQRADFTDEMPEVARRLERRADLLANIGELIGSRIAGLEGLEEEYARVQKSHDERVEAYPVDERAQLDKALAGVRQRTLLHLQSRLGGLRTRQTAIAKEAGAIEGRLVQLPEDQRLLAEPMRRLESHSEIVKFLLARQKEAEITHAAMVASAQFIDRPTPPVDPRGPSVPVFALLGLFLGFCTSVGLAFLREAMDRQVVSSTEVEEVTGFSVFGSIPDFRRGPAKVKTNAEHFLALRDDPEGPIAEAYRSLRSNLKFALGPDTKILTCTSSTAGEGKSTTNVDIALAFAMSNRKVLLVDADMRCAAVSRYLDLSPSPGLSDVLEEKVDWRECIQESHEPNLHVLAAGNQPRSPGDLLAGAACDRLIADVREAYDLIIFDVPPVLEVADMDCLATRLDAVLLLYRSGKLPQSALEQAAQQLRNGGANVIGAVMNAVRSSGRKSYGYGNGYGYGERAA